MVRPPKALPQTALPRSTSGPEPPLLEDAIGSDERMRLAIEAIGLATWDVDLESGKALWSENHFRLFGYEPNPQGRADYEMWLQRVHPEDRDYVLGVFEEARRNRTLYRAEYRILRPDGSISWISAAGRFLYGQDSEPRTVSGVLFDVTERRIADQLLRRNFRQLALIADNAPVFIAHCDIESRYLFVNKAYAERFGLTPQDCIGKRIAEVVGEAAYQSFLPHIKTVLQGKPVRFETEIPYITGVRFVHVSYVPDFDSDGQVRGLVAAITDITDRKLAEQQIQRQFAELEAIYETSPLGLCLLDTDLRFRRINRRLAELNGVPVEDHIGRTVREVLPVIADQAEQMMRKLLSTGQPLRFQLHGETPAQPGVQRAWDESWYPLRDANGNITAVGVVTEEITERLQAEEALRKADRISAAGRMAATVAHEINNPLASIVNSLYLLEKEPLGENARKYLEMTQAELQRVVHITRQTLAFHRNSTAPAAFNLSTLAADVVDAFQPVAKAQDTSIEFEAQGEHFMHGFPAEIRQVLTNLLTNSLEADATSVTVRIRPWRDWSQSHRRGVRITFSDNGKGISRKHLISIFEPFFTTKGEKGTGLGLWVARGILAKYEGTIRLRSSVISGKTGTWISIFLPTLVAHVPKHHPKESSSTVA